MNLVNNRTISALIINTALIAAFSSCGALKNMDEMKDTTNHMSNTTDKMAGTTEKLAEKTEKMLGTTDAVLRKATMTYADLRQGDAVKMRLDLLKAVDEAKTLEDKYAAAGPYFMAFEYQLYKGELGDSPDKLPGLYESAVKEFLLHLSGFAPRDLSKAPSTLSSDNNILNVIALSAAAHFVNANQAEYAAANGFKTISMTRILKAALTMRQDLGSGKITKADIPSWAKQVILKADLAEYLLQARYNLMTAKFLNTVAGRDVSLIEKLKMKLSSWEAHYFVDTQPQTGFPVANSVMIEEFQLEVDEAASTRKFLASIGVPVMLDPTIKSVISHMKLPEMPKSTSLAELERQNSILNWYDSVLENIK